MYRDTKSCETARANLQQGLREEKPTKFLSTGQQIPRIGRPLTGNLHTQERFYLKKPTKLEAVRKALYIPRTAC